MQASNVWGVAVLRYYFGAMRWKRTELRDLDRKTRKIMRQNGSHHFSASLERLYLPRNEGGRGLQNLEQTWEMETTSAAKYLQDVQDPQVIGAMEQQRTLLGGNEYSFLEEAQDILAKYGIEHDLTVNSEEGSKNLKMLMKEVKTKQKKGLCNRLLAKRLHGIHANQVRRPESNKTATHQLVVDRRTTQSGDGGTNNCSAGQSGAYECLPSENSPATSEPDLQSLWEGRGDVGTYSV